MTGFQRIRRILVGAVMIFFGILLIVDPSEESYQIIIGVLSLGLAIAGIKDILFYFTMARHMVGGRMILVQGVIILDFAIITGSMASVPRIYILLYLIVIHAFSGVVEILRAMEAKRTVAGPWKLKFSHGIINFALALACLVFIRKANTALLIFSVGLIYSAAVRILTAFRRTSFILIN